MKFHQVKTELILNFLYSCGNTSLNGTLKNLPFLFTSFDEPHQNDIYKLESEEKYINLNKTSNLGLIITTSQDLLTETTTL